MEEISSRSAIHQLSAKSIQFEKKLPSPQVNALPKRRIGGFFYRLGILQRFCQGCCCQGNCHCFRHSFKCWNDDEKQSKGTFSKGSPKYTGSPNASFFTNQDDESSSTNFDDKVHYENSIIHEIFCKRRMEHSSGSFSRSSHNLIDKNIDLTLRLGLPAYDSQIEGSNGKSSKTPIISCPKNINPPTSSKICNNCGTDETPLWRKGPNGPKTLCNACGLRYTRDIQKEKQEAHFSQHYKQIF
ncbi:hypothetical protein M9H77_06557 [Catharanthus roseus]|uniref:Uncharacterized protein n=1 Tax=Catharanthus roseus TaxID=4058 RepID=A0ACC0BSF4_CATRO|nr:hypothetical protein M9H77_06557 [Catharanthus roseus]